MARQANCLSRPFTVMKHHRINELDLEFRQTILNQGSSDFFFLFLPERLANHPSHIFRRQTTRIVRSSRAVTSGVGRPVDDVHGEPATQYCSSRDVRLVRETERGVEMRDECRERERERERERARIQDTRDLSLHVKRACRVRRVRRRRRHEGVEVNLSPCQRACRV